MSSYPKVDITTDTKFVGKKGDFLQNISIKQKIIGLITDKLRQCGCAVVQAENDADVDIVKAAVAVASSKSTTVVGEDTDLLVLLLYYTVGIESFEIYLRSDILKNTIYDICEKKHSGAKHMQSPPVSSCIHWFRYIPCPEYLESARRKYYRS